MTPRPMPPKTSPRRKSPRSRRRARLRAAHSDGSSRNGNGRAVTGHGHQTTSSISCRPLPPVSFRNTAVSSSSAPPAIARSSSTVPLGDDPAPEDDADAVAHLLGDLERMGAHQDGDAALAHAAEDVLDQPRPARVEADHRLVDQHRLGPVQEGGAHHQPLLHAVREALDQLVPPPAQLEQLEHLADAGLDRGLVHAVEAAVEAQELAGGELLVDERPIGDETERRLGGLGLVGQVVAVDDDAAGGGLEQAGDEADGGGLAGAVGAEEAVDLARLHVERHAVDRGELAVLLAQVLHADHRAPRQ